MRPLELSPTTTTSIIFGSVGFWFDFFDVVLADLDVVGAFSTFGTLGVVFLALTAIGFFCFEGASRAVGFYASKSRANCFAIAFASLSAALASFSCLFLSALAALWIFLVSFSANSFTS